MISDPIFYLFAIPAVLTLGLAKGGFAGAGIVALPLAALGAHPVQAATILMPIMMIQDMFSIWAYWRKWDRRNLIMLLPSAAIGVMLGYLLASRLSMGAFNVALGLISFAFAMRYFLLKDPPATKGGPLLGSIMGGLAGFTSMIAHSGGVPFQIFVMPQKLPRDIFVGTSIAFFMVMNWVKLPFFVALGGFTPQNLVTTAVLIPWAIASTWLGILLVRRVNAERFYLIVYSLLASVGLKLVWDGAHALAG